MRQLFFDTETTGLSADDGDRIVEIGLVEMVGRRLTGNDRHWYLNPERASSPEAERVHGLSADFLADKPRFAQIADELLAYIAGAELVIHNAAFDLGFLDAELQRLGRGRSAELVTGIVDTLAMARELFPGKSNNLDALCRRLEVDASARTVHGALLDAGLLAQVYIRLTRGQDSLVIDVRDERGAGAMSAEAVDFGLLELPVLRASAEELAAHEAVLDDLDKASQGRVVWRPALA
ncbi:MAG TPA: DNA polymerase III subunit epsilon [Rubrivivax sp.]|jgi:DNA polymerase-3 subunit epsilon|nr:DNA polymerase III subunit epsilon [Rubrivivax sp.]